MDVIASRKNPFVAAVRRVADGDDRDRVLLDGLHLLEEARAAQVPIASAAFTARALAAADGKARRLATALAGTGVRVVQVADPVMEALSPTAHPSGVVAVAARPKHALDAVVGRPGGPAALVVVAVDVQDPGNVGAIARVAEAAGATGYVVAGQSADPFGWKALRGSMGSVLRLPTVHDGDATTVAGVLRAKPAAVPGRGPGRRGVVRRRRLARADRVLRRRRRRRPARGAAADGRSPRPHPDGGTGRIAQRGGVGRRAALRSVAAADAPRATSG